MQGALCGAAAITAVFASTQDPIIRALSLPVLAIVTAETLNKNKTDASRYAHYAGFGLSFLLMPIAAQLAVSAYQSIKKLYYRNRVEDLLDLCVPEFDKYGRPLEQC